MIAAKMNSDRARKELTKGANGQKKPRETIRIKDKVAGKEAFPSRDSVKEAEVFRRSTAAALAARNTSNGRLSISFNDNVRKRSSVVAMVTKRVELLHMNVISREFTQVLVSSVEGTTTVTEARLGEPLHPKELNMRESRAQNQPCKKEGGIGCTWTNQEP